MEINTAIRERQFRRHSRMLPRFSTYFPRTQPASVLKYPTISRSGFAYICWFVKLHLSDCETDKFNKPDGNLSYLLVPLTSPTISWTMRFALDKSSQGLQLKWANALRVTTLFLRCNLNSLLLLKVSVSNGIIIKIYGNIKICNILACL